MREACACKTSPLWCGVRVVAKVAVTHVAMQLLECFARFLTGPVKIAHRECE